MSSDEIEKFEKKLNYKSLFNHLRENRYTPNRKSVLFKDFPTAALLVLNEQGEMQYGDTIIFYDQEGAKNFVLGGEQKLQQVRNNLLKSDFKYSQSPVRTLQKRDLGNDKANNGNALSNEFKPNVTNNLVAVGIGQPDARHQVEYIKDPFHKKAVFELSVYKEYDWWYGDIETLYAKIRFEYYHTTWGWLPAGETVAKSMSNITGSIYMYNPDRYLPFTNHATSGTTNYELGLILGKAIYNTSMGLTMYVNCSGYFSAYVIPDNVQLPKDPTIYTW